MRVSLSPRRDGADWWLELASSLAQNSFPPLNVLRSTRLRVKGQGRPFVQAPSSRILLPLLIYFTVVCTVASSGTVQG